MLRYALTRPEVAFNVEAIASFFSGKRVLITGAAGSIGSALAVRLAQIGCAHLTLLDQFDHGLIDAIDAVRREAPSQQVDDLLCDVRDANRLDACIRRAQPDIVIHSAALKHVHMGERHPVECVLTNLVGVRNALAAATNAGAGHFILVSSDKAAAPTCVMGATKRLAELHLRGFAMESRAPIQVRAVRFGNVLGTQGSVLPRWRDQIEKGGPLEVTHADMERFFMSADEAVSLILSAAAAKDATNAATYYMEMGASISILDMGRQMIAESGRDVEIKFTGLRPGEKLKEQLFDDYEHAEATSLPNVFSVTPHSADAYVTGADIAHLESIARTMDNAVVRQRVFAHLDERLGREDKIAG
ncbi:MAG: SDR family NAD(P)-dependent oxidoreductase [Hyphomonadaceae bacterium]